MTGQECGCQDHGALRRREPCCRAKRVLTGGSKLAHKKNVIELWARPWYSLALRDLLVLLLTFCDIGVRPGSI